MSSPKHNALTRVLLPLRDYIYFDFLGGPRVMPMRYPVNAFKALTGIWILFLMHYFQNYSTGMYLYLFLHGSYGLCWLLKDIFTPDATFLNKASIGSITLISILLSLYWVMPVTIASGYGIQEPSRARICLCLILYITGVILMMGSDVYKNRRLKVKKGLISDGFFKRTRNPNYLGEVMIYGSFAICTGYWVSYAIVLFVWLTLFATNIYLKDELSYKWKQGWDTYKQQSYIFLPKIFASDIANYALYGCLAVAAVYFAKQSHEMASL